MPIPANMRPAGRSILGASRAIGTVATPSTASAATSLLSQINRTNLVGLWDPGDLDSYDPAVSATAFNSLAGTAGYNLTLANLTPLGIPGTRAAQCFRGGTSGAAALASNPTWLADAHKTGGQGTIIALVQKGATGVATLDILSTQTSATDPGIRFYYHSAGTLRFAVGKVGSLALGAIISDAELPFNEWALVAVSWDSAGTGYFRVNKGYAQVSASDTWSASYSTPTSNAATLTGSIAAGSVVNSFAVVGAYSAKVDTTVIDGWADALKSRYPTLLTA